MPTGYRSAITNEPLVLADIEESCVQADWNFRTMDEYRMEVRLGVQCLVDPKVPDGGRLMRDKMEKDLHGLMFMDLHRQLMKALSQIRRGEDCLKALNRLERMMVGE
jgi:hypothetical protein